MMRPQDLEQKYVHQAYDETSNSIDYSNYKAWPKVVEFLNMTPRYSTILDVGCGHGKYLDCIGERFMVGVDACTPLIMKCGYRPNASFLAADILNLPFRSNSFIGAICIAVIHHLSTEKRRLKAIQEIIRVVKPGGHLLLYVWAKEQKHREFSGSDILVPYQEKVKASVEPKPSRTDGSSDSLLETVCANDIQKIDVKDSPAHKSSRKASKIQGLLASFSPRRSSFPSKPADQRNPSIGQITQSSMQVGYPGGYGGTPPSTGRRQSLISEAVSSGISKLSTNMGKRVATWFGVDFEAKLDAYVDDLVTDGIFEGQRDYARWTKDINASNQTEQSYCNNLPQFVPSYRYYHVFQKGELLNLVLKLDDVIVIDSYYDHSNWCVLIEKL